MEGRAGAAERSREVGEFAEEGAGVAGVDDFFDPEGFGRAERGAEFVEAVFDLGHLRLTV